MAQDADCRAADAASEPAILPAAGPAALRELHGRQPAACRAGCGSTSATSTPIAAGPTIWPTKPATRSAASPCWTGGRRCSASATRARRRIRCSSPCRKRSASSIFRSSRFIDLLAAFRQDQRVTRYETVDAVVGILPPLGQSGGANGALSGAMPHAGAGAAVRFDLHGPATGQLLPGRGPRLGSRPHLSAAGRLPAVRLRRSGCFARRECNDAFRRCWPPQVERAEGWLRAGLPLALKMPAGLRLPVALFAAGGLATLEAIRRQRFDVWTHRPTVSRSEKLRLLFRCWWKSHFGGRGALNQ